MTTEVTMFNALKQINSRPSPFQFYTADELWTNEHTAKQMLAYHLNESIDLSSRNKNFIDRSVAWISSYFEIDKNSEIADFGCGPGLYTTRLAERWLQYYSPDTLTKEFEENGFKIEESYSDVAGTVFTPDSLEIAVVAKKL
jgi:hypothetical protein